MRTCLLILAHAVPLPEVVGTLTSLSDGFEAVEECAIFVDARDGAGLRTAVAGAGIPWPRLVVCADPRRYGYGGHRKIALEYALRQGFEIVAIGDAAAGQPLAAVPALLRRLENPAAECLIAARPGKRRGAALLRAFLGSPIHDWESGLRLYRRTVLERIPFQLCADDRSFDTEILIQVRALGVEIAEVPLAGFMPVPLRPALRWSPADSLAAILRYRLHQVHLTRRGQFLVEPDLRYRFKRSRYGSHVQILDVIRPGTRVLDLGCSQGLLASPLAAKRVRVTGLDLVDPARLRGGMDGYYRQDLEEPLELSEGRIFDYVVVADVIEHLRRRTQLLRSARRHLKPDGRLLISTPNVAIWFYRLSLFAGRFEYGPRGVLDQTHVHLYTRATFRREVERSGFRVLRERFTALPFELIFESTGQSRVIRGLSAAYHLLARAWPEMFAYQFIVEAEVTNLHDPSEQPPAGAIGGDAGAAAS